MPPRCRDAGRAVSAATSASRQPRAPQHSCTTRYLRGFCSRRKSNRGCSRIRNQHDAYHCERGGALLIRLLLCSVGRFRLFVRCAIDQSTLCCVDKPVRIPSAASCGSASVVCEREFQAIGNRRCPDEALEGGLSRRFVPAQTSVVLRTRRRTGPGRSAASRNACR